MSDYNFHNLRKRLLQGGITPKHADRTVIELNNHYADLKRDAMTSGMSSEEASAHAQASVGDQDVIVNEMLSKPELISWSSRWPWAVYGVGATVAFIASAILSLLLLTFAGGRSVLSPY